MNILLTGASGFLGRHIARRMIRDDSFRLTAGVRADIDLPVAQVCVPDGLDHDTDWSGALRGQDVVIHAAARAHVLKDDVANPLVEYRRVNVAGTLTLARQAAESGVRRFLFISSIGVNGNINTVPFTHKDAPAPAEPYALSKLEAEQGLLDLVRNSDME